MNTDIDQRLVLALAAAISGICILICVVTWYPVSMLEAMREDYDSLENERSDLVMTVENYSIVQDNLQKVEASSPKNIRPVEDIVEFYAYVRQAAENNNIEIISTRQNQSSVNINLRGGYYSLMHLIADWRSMPAAGKITSIKIQRDKDAPAYLITADVTIAALMNEDNENNNQREN